MSIQTPEFTFSELWDSVPLLDDRQHSHLLERVFNKLPHLADVDMTLMTLSAKLQESAEELFQTVVQSALHRVDTQKSLIHDIDLSEKNEQLITRFSARFEGVFNLDRSQPFINWDMFYADDTSLKVPVACRDLLDVLDQDETGVNQLRSALFLMTGATHYSLINDYLYGQRRGHCPFMSAFMDECRELILKSHKMTMAPYLWRRYWDKYRRHNALFGS